MFYVKINQNIKFLYAPNSYIVNNELNKQKNTKRLKAGLLKEV